MNATLIFLVALGGLIAWWMAGQRLLSKPWLESGPLEAAAGAEDPSAANARMGLYVFLGIVGALFSLFISAYLMRMAAGDWWSVPLPRLLWVNTLILATASALLEAARWEIRQGRTELLRLALAAGCAAILLFVVGQIQAWRQLLGAGYLLAGNPANSFFYLLTGLHGLHMLGGLMLAGRTSACAFKAPPKPRQLNLYVELSAIYCHFMVAVWLVLFALFAGWANDFADLCRQLVT